MRWQVLKKLSDRTPLRTKLITAVLALVIMALAAISVASVVMLRSYVTTQNDGTLQNALSRLSRGATLPLEGYAEPFAQGSELVVAVQSAGKQVKWPTTNGFPSFGGPGYDEPLPQLPTGTGWASATSVTLITAAAQTGPNSWRVIAESVTDPTTNATATLIVAYPLGNLNAMTTRLVLFDLIVGGAIVIVVAAVGIAVVRTNLRKLNDIEMTAVQIAAGHLDHRIPEGDPRTEVGSLGRSLNAMLSQIERAFHAQEESERAAHQSEERMRRFIADASHELRTPLTTIRGFAAHYRQRGGAADSRRSIGASIGREDQIRSSGTVPFVPASPGNAAYSEPAGDGMAPHELDHLMGRVEAEATRMGVLVEDLLTLARLDQQRPLNITPVDLLTVAADAVQDARIVSPGRPIDLIVAPGTAFLVDGDEPRLRQVLSNLVNNALTHTPADTPVRVKIGSGDMPSPGSGQPVPAVVLDVEDDGPGMPPEQAQRVFERFYRADAARNRASGGTGLGLAIVAGLVNAHGGTVSVRTAPGQGADFEVRLPLSPDAVSDDDPDAELL